ncbi:metallophosphoesterase [Synechococcus sp. RSCCF101]|uniref:metallophosphoesterase family protein n=1 Tax=Synechococcus sp. RSCCF101 TaxID=2511069 RepID=UPI001244A7D4|nr:metallophosphoesterase [Synechococcus sp. RSCCF101]QEY31572.1 metallophosphoesterase [Synechococcus sp. RSCCF101]
MDSEPSETAASPQREPRGGTAALSRRHSLALLGGTAAALSLGRALPTRAAAPARTTARSLPTLPRKRGLRLACISDLNGPYGTTGYIPTVHRAVAMIPELDVDLVLCAGDMVAGQKRGLGRTRVAAMWAGFERDVLSPLRRRGLPFLPAMGNHDASSLRSGGGWLFPDDRAEALRFWSARRDALGLTYLESSTFPFAYGVRHGDLAVLVWDASSAGLPDGQAAWANRMLTRGEARSARTRLVMGHLPLHAVARGRDRDGEVLHGGPSLLAMLESSGAQAYISGHHHAWYPARAGGLDLLHLGAAGNGPRRLLGTSAAGRHTLTVIDLVDGRPLPTTIDLSTGRVIGLNGLPPSLTDRNGSRLQRWRADHQLRSRLSTLM